jgi:hypothetical protein
VEFDEF